MVETFKELLKLRPELCVLSSSAFGLAGCDLCHLRGACIDLDLPKDRYHKSISQATSMVGTAWLHLLLLLLLLLLVESRSNHLPHSQP
jgi:hypothetical protein